SPLSPTPEIIEGMLGASAATSLVTGTTSGSITTSNGTSIIPTSLTGVKFQAIDVNTGANHERVVILDASTPGQLTTTGLRKAANVAAASGTVLSIAAGTKMAQSLLPTGYDDDLIAYS